tara:strand:- start:2019 stop:2402 length:384 start_codon:yes stop_codon:yes gene_type:complete
MKKRFVNISELSKILNLIDPVSKKPLNHILRFWEKEFKQIKPKRINNRRYYSLEMVEKIKMIKFLLKNEGMTITGVNNILDLNTFKLDGINSDSLKADYYKKNIKLKSKIVLNKLKKLRKYGKKNSR